MWVCQSQRTSGRRKEAQRKHLVDGTSQPREGVKDREREPAGHTQPGSQAAPRSRRLPRLDKVTQDLHTSSNAETCSLLISQA